MTKYGLAFYLVASMDCCVPTCNKHSGPPDHVKTVGSGGKDEKNLVPICYEHHTERHKAGIDSFEEKYDVDLKQVAEETWTTISEIMRLANSRSKKKG